MPWNLIKISRLHASWRSPVISRSVPEPRREEILPSVGFLKAFGSALLFVGALLASPMAIAQMEAEISVSGNTEIADGDTVPDSRIGTDCGEIAANEGLVIATFTIENTGFGALILGPNAVKLDGHADFAINQQPAATVEAGQKTEFKIRFTPSAIGDRFSTVSINHDASDASPFTFAIKARGSGTPMIRIFGNGREIRYGDEVPSLGDDTDFGAADLLSGMVSRTFVISNPGDDTLTLGSTDFFPEGEISLDGSGDFAIVRQPARTLVAKAETEITIAFDPSGLGNRTATLSIDSDAVLEDPFAFGAFSFVIRGTGTVAPEISVEGNGVEITDGDEPPNTFNSTDFGVGHK